ncbi:MAG TPA: phage major capsid protein [Acidimicrobiales bacterium]
MTIDEILAALQAIIDQAAGRSLTDDEMARYEQLEDQLASVRRSAEIVKRNAAYTTTTRVDAKAFASGSDAVKRSDEDIAFEHYLRTGLPNSDLTVSRAQSAGTDSAGGYLVPDGFRAKLVEKLKAFGGIAAEADEITTDSGNPLPFPTNDDTSNSGEIVAEGGTFASGADVVFGIKTLGAYKYSSGGASNLPVKVSFELMQDAAFNVEELVGRKLSTRIGRKQARDWAIGTGSGEPQGLLVGGTSSAEIASNTIGINYAELVAAENAVDIAYLEGGNCKWYMSQGVWGLVQGLVDGNGRPLVNLSTDGISGKPVRSLLGYPVVLDNSLPASWGDQAKTLAFGDIKAGYVIRRVKEVTVQVLRELYAPNGQIGIFAWARADGLVQDAAAFTVISGKNV